METFLAEFRAMVEDFQLCIASHIETYEPHIAITTPNNNSPWKMSGNPICGVSPLIRKPVSSASRKRGMLVSSCQFLGWLSNKPGRPAQARI